MTTTGACSVSNMTCFGSAASEASQVCNMESSGGNIFARSGTDLCKTGESFSHGLFQINVFAHPEKIGGGCQPGFFVKNGSSAQGDCLKYKTNSGGVTYCAIRDCAVTNKAVYNACQSALYDPENNIRIACQLFANRPDWGDWITSAKRCGVY